MPKSSLEEFLQPFPKLDPASFIFEPSPSGSSRTWIFRTTEAPAFILSFHFSSFLTTGWKVQEGEGSLTAQKGGDGVSVNVARRHDETRITYEVKTQPIKITKGDVK